MDKKEEDFGGLGDFDKIEDFAEFGSTPTAKQPEHPFGMEIDETGFDFSNNSYESKPSFEENDVRDMYTKTSNFNEFEKEYVNFNEKHTQEADDYSANNNNSNINTAENNVEGGFLSGIMLTMGLLGIYYILETIYRLVGVYL